MMYYSAVIASSIVHRQHTLDFLCGFQAVRLLDSTTLALHVSNVGILRVGSWMILWPNPCLQASGLWARTCINSATAVGIPSPRQVLVVCLAS
jgi:hypothetical protein